ncbi:NADPH-dependent FMN reductase [Shewanella sp. GXUN23E]|uniref:NADPH-dependent FMN reductase n=1 Tax=Shewanella sp. GXUN23E TaxID=3422498 RepID=UPI003D7E623B
MKVIAFAASSSRHSINKQLVSYACGLLPNAQVTVLDLNDFELPLFSEDREKELGHPQLAQDFFALLGSADALVISFAEHNGSYTAAYKNLFDWTSRINPKVFQGKPVIALATSPGAGGAASVLATAVKSMPYFGGEVKGQFSLPAFNDNFDRTQGCVKPGPLADQLAATMAML